VKPKEPEPSPNEIETMSHTPALGSSRHGRRGGRHGQPYRARCRGA
jgi:hypothetical protein